MAFNILRESTRGNVDSGFVDVDASETSIEDDFELSEIPDMTPPVSSLISSLLMGQIKNSPVTKECSGTPEMDKENFIVKKTLPRRIVSSNQLGTPNSRTHMDIFKRPIVPESDDIENSMTSTKRIKSVSHTQVLSSPASSYSGGGVPSPLRNSTNVQSTLVEHPSDEDEDMTDLDTADMELDKSWECPTNSFFSGVKSLQKRSQSDSAVSIMRAVERIDSDSLLIGDGSGRYILPIKEDGKHSDLKEISPHTLHTLIKGHFKNLVKSYEIIDCRYPYEYLGGHIQGAINLHTQKQVHERYLQNKKPMTAHTGSSFTSTARERRILIFHCEFSSQRAPDLCRFLRQADRQCNLNAFPCLHYPELYVLFGGYKNFFQLHRDLCEPQQYVEMTDPQHVQACRWHKSKSKTELVSTKASSQDNNPSKIQQRKNSFKMLSL